MAEFPDINISLSESVIVDNNEPIQNSNNKLVIHNIPTKEKKKEALVQEYLESQSMDKDDSTKTEIATTHATSNETADLEKLLDEHYLNDLLKKFLEKNDDSATVATNTTAVNEKIATMTIDEFRETNLILLKSNNLCKDVSLNKSIDLLFQKIDSNGENMISWDDLCTYIIKRSKDDDKIARKVVDLNLKPRIVKFSSLKDTIAKVLKDSNQKRLISVSKSGSIDILSTDLSVLRHSTVNQFESSDNQQLKRRMKVWVTDAICLQPINKLVVSTANRDLRFYDLSAANINEIFVLGALPNVALCLFYHFEELPESTCKLFFGVDNGDIHLLNFRMPSKSLFEMPFKKSDSSWRILYTDLAQQSRVVTHKIFAQQHSDWVKKLKYYPEGEIMISCSNNAKDSLIVCSINERKTKQYIFRVTKEKGTSQDVDVKNQGIECFDYHKELSLIATGGLDHILRLWDPYVTSKPMAILKSHQTAIIDLFISSSMNQVFSYSKDGVAIKSRLRKKFPQDLPGLYYNCFDWIPYSRCIVTFCKKRKLSKNIDVKVQVLCIWDVKDQMCVHSLQIKYPFIGYEFDHGTSPVCVTNENVYIAAENCIAQFHLLKSQSRKVISCTHTSPVLAGLFLTNKKQLVTICEEGDTVVWDIMTGEEILSLNKYPKEEISAVTVDESGSYLITGTRDGKGRGKSAFYRRYDVPQEKDASQNVDGKNQVWNLLNGIDEKQLVAYNNEEITSITVLPHLRIIFMFGWARKILAYTNHVELQSLQPDKRWLSLDAHADDILCGVYAKPDYLCTCSYDGDIILWNFERRKMMKKIQTANQGMFIRAVSLVRSSMGSRSSARKRQTVKRAFASTAQVPVEILLHLNTLPYHSNATLISVEGNVIKFWNTIVVITPIIRFKAFENDEIDVTSLATNVENTYLFMGSSHGLVMIFDIQRFTMVEKQSQESARGIKLNGVTVPTTKTIPPPLLNEWFAHEDDTITSISCSRGLNELFLFTSSTDCSVVMWSFNGEKIGMFGDGNNSSLMLSGWLKKVEPRKRATSILSAYSNNFMEENEEKVDLDSVSEQESALPPINHVTFEDVTSSLSNDVEKMQNLQLYKDRSQILQDAGSMKLSSSVLGEKFNTGCDRRMKDRKHRRDHYSDVGDKAILSLGGVSNLCSPFKALATSDVNDFVLPPGMPITPKMLNKRIDPYNTSSLSNINSIANWKT